MNAEEILKLIEEVDPAYTDKLDEIDARVLAGIYIFTYVIHKISKLVDKRTQLF